MTAVRVLTNACILTPDGIADSVSVRNGKIESIGESRGEKNRKVIDMGGRCIIPGFIDSHTHLLRLGLELNGLSLEGMDDRTEVLSRIRDYVNSSPGDIIVGYGWDESLWKNNDFIDSDDLAFTRKPVVLFRRDDHMAVVNEPVLKALSVPAGEDSRKGILKEEELEPLREFIKPDDKAIRDALQTSIAKAVSLGIVSARDIVDLATEKVYSTMKTEFHVTRALYDYEYDGRFTSSGDRWGIKMFLDGSIGAHTSAHRGGGESNLKISGTELDKHLGRFWKNGLPAAVHAIGDIAVETAVDALSRSPESLTNSIEHFELVEDNVLDSVGKNTFISAQPNFLMWAGKNGLYDRNLGSEWLQKNNPYRKILDRNIKLAFGSDCMPIGPVLGIHYATNSEYSSQRITMNEAIRAYTEGSASLIGLGHRKGKIEPGYDADLVVFDQDFLSKGSELKYSKPMLTMIGGRIVFSRNENITV